MTDLYLIRRVYDGSDGGVTRGLYSDLEAIGPMGVIAMNLFRASKCSERAKSYRKGPGHRTEAYRRKDWSIENLATALESQTAAGGVSFAWGWGVDAELQAKLDPHHHILYVELPTGQASFHVGHRYAGPDFAGGWDGCAGVQADRICRFVVEVLKEAKYVPA